MTTADFIAALQLRPATRVDRRVPKRMLSDHGAPTAADRRQIEECIEELWWLAALKPGNVGVPEYRDEQREYSEIAVLTMRLRGNARSARLRELVHRAIPYPVLLVDEDGDGLAISVAHKRRSLGEAGAVVLDGAVVGIDWDDAQDAPHAGAFRDAVALVRQPRTSMHALYEGWRNAILALLAARRTGSFHLPGSPEEAARRATALDECDRLAREATRLRSAAVGERQLARQVDLNLELKRTESALADARQHL